MEELRSDQAENLLLHEADKKVREASESQPFAESQCEQNVQVEHSDVPDSWMDLAENEALIFPVPNSWMDLAEQEESVLSHELDDSVAQTTRTAEDGAGSSTRSHSGEDGKQMHSQTHFPNELTGVHGTVNTRDGKIVFAETVADVTQSFDSSAFAELDTLSPGKSGHSRQRKNLVNLNKAVVKWQKRVELGTLPYETMLERIRASPAAAHLQAVHKDGFEEGKFVQDVLQHTGAVESNLMRRASVGGA